MKANRLFITLFIFLMTSVSFAQKLKPSLHFSHLAKSIEKERFALNVNQIRYLENDTVEEQYTLVIDGNKKTPFFCITQADNQIIQMVNKKHYFIINMMTNELVDFKKGDKETYAYEEYRINIEGQNYSLLYYLWNLHKLPPYSFYPISNEKNTVIRNTPISIFTSNEELIYYKSKDKSQKGKIQQTTNYYVNTRTYLLDSLKFTYAYDNGKTTTYKEYVSEIKNFDFDSFYKLLDFNNPKYANYSRHDNDNFPESLSITDNEIITPEILCQPITNTKKQITTLSKTDGWILLDFWQFGCSGCFAQFKSFQHEKDSLGYRILENNGVKVFSIHPYSDNMELIQKVADKYDANDYIYSSKGFTKLLHISSYPTYYLISPNKKIVLKTNNLGDYSEILNIIKNTANNH